MKGPGSTSVPSESRKALVLSGGGSLGAYQVGVLQALARGLSRGNGHQPFDPSMIVGTSAGAFNAVFLATQTDVSFAVAVDRLTEVWLQRIADRGRGNGVFRFRLDPCQFFSDLAHDPALAVGRLENDLTSIAGTWQHQLGALPAGTPALEVLFRLFDLGHFLSLEPFVETIRRTIRFDRLATSTRDLVTITATWPELTMRELHGREAIWQQQGECILVAGVAIPGIFPPTIVDGRCMVDGGLLANTPLAPAINAGASELHLLVPLILPWLSEYRQLPIGSLSDLYQIVAGAACAQCFVNLRDIAFLNTQPDLGPNGDHARHGPSPPYADCPPAEIDARLYLPSHSLGARLWELLDFRYERIVRLIEQGFRDGIRQQRFQPTEIIDDPERSDLFAPFLGAKSPYGPEKPPPVGHEACQPVGHETSQPWDFAGFEAARPAEGAEALT